MAKFDLNAAMGEPLEQAYAALADNFGHAIGFRPTAFDDHTRRVTVTTVQFAQVAGLLEDQLIHVMRGAALHDIGKIIVPAEVLLKPGILTDDEWQLVRRHPEVAHQIMNVIDELRAATDIPYYHHERWDGKGYPHGLAHDAIPLAARLFIIVDVWDALNNDQPYRKAWPREKALTYLRDHTRLFFDPDLLTTFLEMAEA